MGEFVAYVAHVSSGQRKYVKSSELLEVEDLPKLKAWAFVPGKPPQLFVKRKEYGKKENGKIVRYYSLLMESK